MTIEQKRIFLVCCNVSAECHDLCILLLLVLIIIIIIIIWMVLSTYKLYSQPFVYTTDNYMLLLLLLLFNFVIWNIYKKA